MEIQSLRLLVNESDLNELAFKLLPLSEKIRDLRIALIPEGIRITGTYQAVIGIPFEMLWEVFICERKLAVRLQKLQTAALSLGFATDYVLKAIAAAVSVLEQRDDVLLLDLELLLRQKGLPLRTNLTAAHCDYGSLIVESGGSR